CGRQARRCRRNRELPHVGFRRGREGVDRRQGGRRDLRSGGRRGAGKVRARGGLRCTPAGRGFHVGGTEQAHVQPRVDQGADRDGGARRRDAPAPAAHGLQLRRPAQARCPGRDAPAHLAPLSDGTRRRRLSCAARPKGRRQGGDRDGYLKRIETRRSFSEALWLPKLTLPNASGLAAIVMFLAGTPSLISSAATARERASASLAFIVLSPSLSVWPTRQNATA